MLNDGIFSSVMLIDDSPAICWRSARAAMAQARPPDGDEDDPVGGPMTDETDETDET